MIPLFDFESSIEINLDKFNANYAFIQTENQNRSGVVIAFAVLSSVTILLAIVATVFYCLKKKKIEPQLDDDSD